MNSQIRIVQCPCNIRLGLKQLANHVWHQSAYSIASSPAGIIQRSFAWNHSKNCRSMRVLVVLSVVAGPQSSLAKFGGMMRQVVEMPGEYQDCIVCTCFFFNYSQIEPAVHLGLFFSTYPFLVLFQLETRWKPPTWRSSTWWFPPPFGDKPRVF